MTALDEAIREAEEALAITALRYPNGWGGYDTLSECTEALRSLLAATKSNHPEIPESSPAPALPRYTRVIHTTAGDMWQTSDDGILWRDTPRVYFGDGALDAARSPR